MAETKLIQYRAKRDFGKTAEPSGDAVIAPSERLRFVVQKYAARRLHYDLRLELDGVFTLRSVPALLAKTDAWKDYCDSKRPLEEAIRSLSAKAAA